MQALVGDPPRGRWEHPGLRGAFVAKLAERGLPIDTRRELRKQLRYLLDAREVADYREDEVEADTARDALEIARETLRLAEECAT
jgi:phage terminase Nu1 subunit (DNA packaging protein)